MLCGRLFLQRPLRLRGMRRDEIHQRRAKAVVGLEFSVRATARALRPSRQGAPPFAASVTLTGALVHLQVSVPPLKSLEPAVTPLSIDGCSLMAMMCPSSF